MSFWIIRLRRGVKFFGINYEFSIPTILYWTKKVQQFRLVCLRFLSRQEHKFELVLISFWSVVNLKNLLR